MHVSQAANILKLLPLTANASQHEKQCAAFAIQLQLLHSSSSDHAGHTCSAAARSSSALGAAGGGVVLGDNGAVGVDGDICV